jgi:hypothetical protein
MYNRIILYFHTRTLKFYNKLIYYKMDKAIDKKLYQQVKDYIYAKIPKHSAYRSGHVIKEYKKRGGKFKEDGKERKLSRWFKEKWKDVNPEKTRKSYPVYRPTIRVNKRTPLTFREIDKKDLIKQSRRKQIIKGSRNLRPFKKSIKSKKPLYKSNVKISRSKLRYKKSRNIRKSRKSRK